jgi:hypothetical protein
MVNSMQSVASASCSSLGVVKRVGGSAGGADKLHGADHLSRSGHFARSDPRLAEFLPPETATAQLALLSFFSSISLTSH